MANSEFKNGSPWNQQKWHYLVHGSNEPHMHPPWKYEAHRIVLLGPTPTWKADATITKLGWRLHVGRHLQNGHQRSEITSSSITQHLGSIEANFYFWVRSYSDHLAMCHLPQLHEQVSMALETSGIRVCHQSLFEVQQLLRTNLSWCLWWMKSGTQMPLL